MKNLIMVSVGLFLTNSICFAKNIGMATVQKSGQATVASKVKSQEPIRLVDGFVLHAGIVKPSSNFSAEQTSGGRKINGDVSMNSALGLRLGISRLPVGELGWDAQLVQIFIDQHPTTSSGLKSKASIDGIQRMEGNLAYAFNEKFFAKGGLNLSTVSTSNTDAKLNSSFGYQLGLGFEVLDNLGVHMDYVAMRHKTDNRSTINGVDVSTNLSTDATGLELGVSALF